MGYCGIRPLALDGNAETEIAWRVEKTRWSEGMATEAATAVRNRFEDLHLIALIPPEHKASLRVGEKLALRPEGTTVLDGDTLSVYAS